MQNSAFHTWRYGRIHLTWRAKEMWLQKTSLGVDRRLPSEQVIERCPQRVYVGSNIGVPCVASILL
jgi:hypothetical protein